MSDIIEAAARALANATEWSSFWDGHDSRQLASAVLVAVTPLIRAQVLEEAAVVAEDEDGEFWYAGEHRNMVMLQEHGFEIAAIRVLKEQP